MSYALVCVASDDRDDVPRGRTGFAIIVTTATALSFLSLFAPWGGEGWGEVGVALHFLIAPNVTPLNKCFLSRNVNTATGTRNRKVPAAMTVQSVSPEPSWDGM